MAPITTEIITRNRLLIDHRPLKTCFRRYVSQVLAARDAERSYLQSDLRGLENGYKKHQLVHDMNEREVVRYVKEQERIEEEILQGQGDIGGLKEKLAEAQKIRANKLEYDIVAHKINALPTRSRSIENAGKLKAKIEKLKVETKALRAKREVRKKHLLSIVAAIHELQNIIAEDKRTEEDRAEEEQLKEGSSTPPLQEEEEEGILNEDDNNPEQRAAAMDLS
ncbi:hypothetical protein DFS34DRAFT_133578 [Phlyctochytrium arcticum]|nr:hypothetical protein DFS34DRAFT_133578 [Phlyctochytrium arcticum]